MNDSAADSTLENAGSFSIRDARELVADLQEHRPLYFMTDVIASLILAYGGGWVFLFGSGDWPIRLLGFAISAFAFYRVGTFMHEIVHFRSGQMRAFTLVWNIFYGLPWLMPSPMYDSHKDHHSNFRYGTAQDPEYLPLGASPPRELLKFMLMLPMLAPLAVIRFGVISPLAWLAPGLRQWTLQSACALAINPAYKAGPQTGQWKRRWYAIETVLFLWVGLWVVLISNGTIEWRLVWGLYLLVTVAIGINWVRTLAAHMYTNDGRPVSQIAQLRDSINLMGPPVITELLFPVGLRYHALHHVLPTLPYHSLPEAHRRLMRKLPADSVYRETVRSSFVATLVELFKSARSSSKTGLDASANWRSAK